MQKTIMSGKNHWKRFTNVAAMVFFAFPILSGAQGINYDSLRIVAGVTNATINSLTMRTDQDTTLSVQGKRSDNGLWESVSATWSIVPGLQTSTVPALASFWKFSPIDTGAGMIVVSRTGSISDTVNAHFIPGLAYSLVLYPAPGAPGGANMPFAPPVSAVSDSAGKQLQLYAKIFDKNGVWLAGYERADAPLTWNAVDLPGNRDLPTAGFSPTSGNRTALLPLRAGNSVLVTARFTDGNKTFSDSVLVVVTPGKPHHLVIENNPDNTLFPHQDNPDTLVQIPGSDTFALVYAVVRDYYGNFVETSKNTSWTSLNAAIVTAAGGTASLGQGKITRTLSGPSNPVMVVAASLDYTGLRDTTTAMVLQYYYLALRIVNSSGNHVAGLTMNTNQDTALYVQGQRSTDGIWENASAQWQSQSGLNTIPSAPGNAQSWKFSPSTPGSGWIRVTLGNDAVTAPDTVMAAFTPGQPVNIQIQVLSPATALIAGDTIVSVVKIFNRDGLVPGQFCAQSTSQNMLGALPGFSPVMIADSISGMGQAQNECFTGGIDTVRYVLYKAPYSIDSLDQIAITLNGLAARSDPFQVHQGDVRRVRIEDFNGTALDTVRMNYPAASKAMFAIGYDDFGNKIGPLDSATWTTDGTLHAIDHPFGSRIYYTSDQATDDESGHVLASFQNAKGATSTGTCYVSIAGPPSAMISAITRDNNGNGFLDRIELHFSGKTTIPATGAQITFSGTYASDPVTGAHNLPYASYLTVDSVASLNQTGTDSVFLIDLAEPTRGSPGYSYFQTGWTPAVSITWTQATVPAFMCTDGAGPVIVSVVKTITNHRDRSTDLVAVTFSEPIRSGVNDFSLLTRPQSVFKVWDDETPQAPVEDPSMLDSIGSFYNLDATKTKLSFYMTNNKDLDSSNYVGLARNNAATPLTDARFPPNPPAENNRYVKVEVIGEIDGSTDNPDRKCGCGAGTGLAFLPPIGFRIASFARKRKKK
jgi:hypothetical protein